MGIKAVRLHDLRHFAATHMLTSGVDVRTVSGRLGHDDASTTLGVYSQFMESADADAADVLGNLVAGLPTTELQGLSCSFHATGLVPKNHVVPGQSRIGDEVSMSVRSGPNR